VSVSAEVSADPKSEVVEALRWVRQLLASGQAKAEEIAIAATSTPDWDDHFLAYVRNAGLPLHFPHGVPALSTPEGQACAALADILTSGLSQERIWRLFRRLPPRPFMGTVPEDWFATIPRSAGRSAGRGQITSCRWGRCRDHSSPDSRTSRTRA
jgi:hypothetical protein